MASPRIVADRYALGALLGAGGMGDVYEATELATNRVVALKIMRERERGIDEDEDGREGQWAVRFEREVQMVRELRSPHIVELLDDGRDPETGERFLVMERLRGEDLGALLRRLGPLPVDLAVRIAAQACVGLECAHEKRIVHRDIKPGNVFLTTSSHGDDRIREVRILDFGIARVGAGKDIVELTELTQTGSMLGSPQYMAPEQARGSKNVDARADIWSLGVVLYRLLTGVSPHQAEADSGLGELLIAVCCNPAPPIQDRAPWVPAELARVVHRALSIEREKRFANAREMRDALVALLPNASYAIDVSMLVPLGESTRKVVAPRAALPRPRASSVTDDHDAPLTSSNTLHAASPSSQRLITLGAFSILFAACAALGIIHLVDGRRAKVPDAAPSAMVAAPRAEAKSPPAATIANVTLGVPPGFRVIVDGAPVAVEGDKVSLSGPLGSTHAVSIVSDTEGERIETVVIAEGGAVPSSIAAPARRSAARLPPAASAPRSPTTTAARPPRVGPAAAAASASEGLRTNFE